MGTESIRARRQERCRRMSRMRQDKKAELLGADPADWSAVGAEVRRRAAELATMYLSGMSKRCGERGNGPALRLVREEEP